MLIQTERVGRESELGALAAWLDEAVGGKRRVDSPESEAPVRGDDRSVQVLEVLGEA